MVDDRPNILLIMTDQQRWDSLGCYGTPGVHTPNLDRLAASGRRYDRCYVNGTICTPSRASLWTGKHLPGHGVYALHDCLPEDQVLFPERLREAGFSTALFGKLHVSGHLREEDRRHPHDGFDVYEWASDPAGPWGMDNAHLQWMEKRDPEMRERIREKGQGAGPFPEPIHLTTWAAERTIDFVRDRQGKENPFFCCMSVFDPHSPYTNCPAEFEDLLDIPNLPEVIAADEPFDHRPMAHWMERDWGPKVPEPETLAKWRIGYHAAVALIDKQVGRVLASLDETGQTESTVVMFASDHGDMLGDHGLMTKGAYFYDACTRVPLIVRAPGHEASVVEAPCQLLDIAATCLGIAGSDDDEIRRWSADGRDLLSDAALADRGRAACLYRNSGNSSRPDGYRGYFDPAIQASMWVELPYKLTVFHTPDPEGEHARGELFDLSSDPEECHSLWDSAEHAGTRARLLTRLADWLTREGVRGRLPIEQACREGHGPGGTV